MKKISYSLDKSFLLTDNEFVLAKIYWKKGETFWCERLGADLTKFYKYAETPENENGKDVLIESNHGIVRKLYKKNKVYYELLENGDSMETELYGKESELESQEFLLDEEFGTINLLEKNINQNTGLVNV